ncbi:MAG: hypothetical protein K9M84_09535 [Spirochaetia bacterium]|nr:hypothetical protein [Spirochaetia bacterium]
MRGDWEGVSGFVNCNNYVPYGIEGRVQDPTHGYWLSCRICPDCGKTMHTNGKEFKCMKSGEVIKFKRVKKKAG